MSEQPSELEQEPQESSKVDQAGSVTPHIKNPPPPPTGGLSQADWQTIATFLNTYTGSSFTWQQVETAFSPSILSYLESLVSAIDAIP